MIPDIRIENTKIQLEFWELFSSGYIYKNYLDELKGQKKFIKHTKLHTKPKFNSKLVDRYREAE